MSNLLFGVLGVLAVAATGAFLKWGKQAFIAIRTAVMPDHKALHRTPAWGLMAVQSGGPSRIRLVIACAPSRSLRRPRFSPDAAIRFVHTHFPGEFPDQPTVSDVHTSTWIERTYHRRRRQRRLGGHPVEYEMFFTEAAPAACPPPGVSTQAGTVPSTSSRRCQRTSTAWTQDTLRAI